MIGEKRYIFFKFDALIVSSFIFSDKGVLYGEKMKLIRESLFDNDIVFSCFQFLKNIRVYNCSCLSFLIFEKC